MEPHRSPQQSRRDALESATLSTAGLAEFSPPRWLRGTHLQTILSSLPPRRWFTWWRARLLRRAAQPWVIDCGALGRLQAWHSPATRAAGVNALLLHGWEGSAESTYVLSLGALLQRHGYDVIRLNLRDHGNTQHLNRELFHSCRLPEVAQAVRQIAQRWPDRPLALAGFSLGGNFLLRVIAEPHLPGNVVGVAAISPVLDPARTLIALESGQLYHDYFVRRWSRSLRLKQRRWPQHFDFADLLQSRKLRAMTDGLVRQHTDFPCYEDYLEGYAITGSRLTALPVPAEILIADDDPIIPAADLSRLAADPHLRVWRTAGGGHCGFMDSLVAPSYADRFVLECFSSWLRKASQRDATAGIAAGSKRSLPAGVQ